jgi:hypothetical protein
MRNKDLFQQKLERFEAEVKKMGYHIHKGELDTAFDKVEELLTKISDMQTLLNTEHQD